MKKKTKRKLILFIIIGLCVLVDYYVRNNYNYQTEDSIDYTIYDDDLIPDNASLHLVEYSGYYLMFHEEWKLPLWVKYELTAKETDGNAVRDGKNFKQDRNLYVEQAANDDYRNSGWSRGHMAPAADFKWSEDAMQETFYFTNCCPQNQSLNAGQWNTLEEKVRGWANKFGSVQVVTGPLLFGNEYGSIGNSVLVPDAFFKAVLSDDQGIAFIMYNRAENDNMQKCAISIDMLESLSGIDLFKDMDNSREARLESSFDLKYWGL